VGASFGLYMPIVLRVKTCITDVGRIRPDFLPKCTWTGIRVGSAAAFVWVADKWVLVLDKFVPGLCTLVCSDIWAFSWIGDAGCDLPWLLLRLLRVFFLFRTCAPENINLQK